MTGKTLTVRFVTNEAGVPNDQGAPANRHPRRVSNKQVLVAPAPITDPYHSGRSSTITPRSRLGPHKDSVGFIVRQIRT